jgi:hypothetical protein
MTKFTAAVALSIPLAALAATGGVFLPDVGGTAGATHEPPAATTPVETTGMAEPAEAPAAVVVAALPAVTDPRARVSISLTPSIEMVGAGGERQARLHEALARFRDNGLELPALEVRFDDDKAACAGHEGLFEQAFTPWRVSICSDLAFVPTHELAHAWEAANLDDDDRARYVEARGLTTWDDPAASWQDRGIEDVAFIIQQNLMAGHPNIDSPTWIDRTAAYLLLTGRVSPLRGQD